MKQSEKKPRLKIFQERFELLRKERGLNNTDFAEFLEMSRQTVGFYLNGDRVPDALNLIKIAKKCNVSADWLLGLTNARSQDIDIRQICEKIGLKEQVIIQLQRIYEGRGHEPETIEGINSILSNSIFQLLARDYVRLKHFTEKVNAEYKEHSFGELEEPIHEEGEVITLKGCRACDYYRAKIIDQFSVMLDMDIPVYQTTAAYLSLLDEGLEKI